MKEKVILGMSGGVDSSVAAYLLKEKGYEVIGISLNQQADSLAQDLDDAREIARSLGIQHHIINIYEEFEDKVVSYFVDSYNRGETPSPCVICDDEIKFKILFEMAEKYGAEYVATGHYTSVAYCKKFSKYLLKAVHNIIKDQSYMLYRLESKKLERLLFPLQDYSKAEIREIARKIGLSVHNKKDSQGICFAKEGYKEFLAGRLKDNIKTGNYIDKFGNILGQHKGYQFYTVGQRRGLGINFSKPVFITEIKTQTNEIVLGEFSELLTDRVELLNYKFSTDIDSLIGIELLARPRFSSTGFLGKLHLEDEKLYFKYEKANAHNTDGQHLVLFYENFVLGGGIIRRTR
ncbi:tRNA 2-thiouridine(34) synthase MnmA [Fusobacterium russii]|uniref:tRNA 2-thiouridine(34) synthase MnmA n=1 Tax=Fusobacterium russii TaxID=854 RepID=UPI0003A02CE6|nr:tRNA 2-thiouridine(34) synthase MnmA [Fusobacterium russii]